MDFAREGTRLFHDNPELYYYEGEAALQLVLLDKTKSSATSLLQSEAVDSFSAGLNLFPYDSRLALKSAQALAAAGNYDKAIESIDCAAKLDPSNSLVVAYRGMIEYSFGHYAEAQLNFQEVEKSGGDEAKAIAHKGLNAIDKRKLIESASQLSTP